MDLFNDYDNLPNKVKKIMHTYYVEREVKNLDGYKCCANLVKRLEKVGYTCSYYLDAEPYDLRKHNAQFYWDVLGNVPVNEDGEIEEDFYEFSEGTDREEIWHWLEYTFNISVAKDLMYLK